MAEKQICIFYPMQESICDDEQIGKDEYGEYRKCGGCNVGEVFLLINHMNYSNEEFHKLREEQYKSFIRVKDGKPINQKEFKELREAYSEKKLALLDVREAEEALRKKEKEVEDKARKLYTTK